MSNFKIYIVEDDEWYSSLLKHFLSSNPDYEITVFKNARDCIQNLYLKPDLITLDFHLPDMEGEQLLNAIKTFDHNIAVVVVSGQEDINTAVQLLKKGADDYLPKTTNTKELLWNTITKIKASKDLKEKVENLQGQLEQKFKFEKNIIGQSSSLKKVFYLIEKAIQSNINICISGETGTGKELVAKAIHYDGVRKIQPFIAINMASIPKELAESELFGHEKGAFTGAIDRKKGKFELANGGTLFLDEIAEMDLNLQSKLLRVLQEREATRIGGTEVLKLNFRLIVASHKNLSEEVSNGSFREDLYYRIMGLQIHMPPLRERGNDILILAKHYITNYCKENNISQAFILKQDALDKLINYSYPGNIRELKSIIELACVMANGIEISSEDILFPSIEKNILNTNSRKTLRDYTIEIIKLFMKKYNNNVVVVADRLDISKSTIYNYIKAGDITL